MRLTEKENYEYCVRTLAFKNDIEKSFLQLGEFLYKIREEKLYEPQWSSFQEYCMEFRNLSSSSISKLVNIYRIYVLEYSFEPALLVKAGGWTVLAETLPSIHSKSDAERFLQLSMTLSRSDLKKELIEANRGIQQKDCRHGEAIVVRICPDCGFKERIYDK